MKEYVLLWRFFPKMALGAVFVAEVLVLTFGSQKIQSLLILMFGALSRYFSGVTLLVVIALVIAIASNLGIFILNFLSSALLDLIERATRGRGQRKYWRVVKSLVEPLHEASLRVFKEDPDLHATFLRLRSLAAAKYEKKKVMESFIGNVIAHMSSIKSVADAAAPNYYTALGQDRRAYEIALDELQLLWNLIIVCLLGVPAVLALHVTDFNGWMVTVALILCAAAALPTLARRKRFWAVFMLGAYMDNFSFGDFVEMVDREGETIL